MKTILRFFESLAGGVNSLIKGLIYGVVIGSILTAIYYVLQVVLSFNGNWIPKPDDMLEAIRATVRFGFHAIPICAFFFAVLGFAGGFWKKMARRPEYKDFLDN